MLLSDTIQQILQGTTGSAIVRGFGSGFEAAAPADEFPLAQRSEILDTVTCPLCRAVDGLIISKSDPRYIRWCRGLHINCRGIMVHIHRTEVGPDGRPTQPTWPADDDAMLPTGEGEPEQRLGDLVGKHGHFVAQPEKYSPLNVPARPTGRDFVAWRPAGQAHVNLRFRDALPDWALQETLKTMASGIADVGALSVAGDVELASQIMDHAAARGLWSDLPRAHADHAADWPGAGTLSEDEYRRVPAQTLSSPTAGIGTDVDADGTATWFVHAERVPIGGRELDEVVVTYRPDRGAIERAFRPPPETRPIAPPEFQSWIEAERWARATYPHMGWDLDGGHPELLREALEQWGNLTDDYPVLAARIRRIRVTSALDTQDGYAYAEEYSRGIALHGAYWRDAGELRRALAEDVQSEWHAPGTGTPAATVTHELGHHAKWMLRDSGMTDAQITAFADAHGFLSISRFGGGSHQEAFAEVFAHMVHSPPNQWLPSARAMDDLLREKGML